MVVEWFYNGKLLEASKFFCFLSLEVLGFIRSLSENKVVYAFFSPNIV